MNKKILVIVSLLTTLFFCALVVCIGAFFLPSSPEVSRLPTLTPTIQAAQPARAGEARRDLGQQSGSFGSDNQARELLKLVKENPDKSDYQITYQSPDDTVIFGCNFDKDIIIRIHQRPDGHGSQETWQGYITERLNAAADGGTLNDTSNGKLPGTMQEF